MTFNSLSVAYTNQKHKQNRNSIHEHNRDITEAALSEPDSFEHEAQSQLVDCIREYAIYRLNPDGEIKSWNQGAERIYGYSKAEAIDRPVSLLYTPEDQAAEKHHQELQIAATTGQFADENWRVRQDGAQIWVNTSITALWSDTGHLQGFALVVRDVTECRIADQALQASYSELERRVEERTEELWRKNEQLEQAHEHLQQLNAELVAQAHELHEALENLKQTQVHLIQAEKMSSLGQLVAGVAHEINNPINFIHGNLNYANQYAKDLLHLVRLYQRYYSNPVPEIQTETERVDLDFIADDLPRLLTSMNVGTERIRQIVLTLRNFSRLDEAEKKAVNIHEGLDSTLLMLQNRLKAKTIRLANTEHRCPAITVVKEYGALPLVECYAGQLNQVFMNILANAIDALEENYVTGHWSATNEQSEPSDGPTIRIRTELLSSSKVAIHIADNGMGMPDRVKQRLFDPFFTTKPVGRGTGLGLSISYQIVVEKHGGQLQCVSSPKQGTEFVIEIPVQQSQTDL